MKYMLRLLIISLALLSGPVPGVTQVPMFPETVSMGPGYLHEVYYQFSTGDTTLALRSSWDISFRTMIMSSSILINDGSGVTLWSYPFADTSGWATVDTFGLSTWTPLYNDPSDWENGAFSRNATGHPDYGWGIYNTVTHVIVGDSLFIIQLVDGSFKKLWIVKKDAPNNLYLFRYANLDGSDPQETTVDCKLYTGKEFVGFNLQTTFTVDYQPVKTGWDILFTKYMSVQPNGEPYPVTGVLSNPVIYAKRFYPVDPEYNDWQVGSWDSTRSVIGWDWKTFSMSSMSYQVNDSMVFYVKDQVPEVYRLKFTAFEGSSTGNIDFGKAKVSSTGFGDLRQADRLITLFPNPADDHLTVAIRPDYPGHEGLTLTICDLTGRKLLSEVVPAGHTNLRLDLRQIPPGAYLLVATAGKDLSLYKFLKR